MVKRNKGGKRRVSPKARSTLNNRIRKVQLNQCETKRADKGAGQLIGTTPIHLNVTDFPLGEGLNERIGNEVILRSFFCRMDVDWNPASAYHTQRIRVIFHFPVDPDDIPPLLSHVEIFDNRRTTVVADYTFNLTQYEPSKSLDFSRVFYTNNRSGRKVVFKDNYSATVIKNRLYMSVISSDDTNKPSISYRARLFYKDP